MTDKQTEKAEKAATTIAKKHASAKPAEAPDTPAASQQAAVIRDAKTKTQNNQSHVLKKREALKAAATDDAKAD